MGLGSKGKNSGQRTGEFSLMGRRRKERTHTKPIDSPRTQTMAWSATDLGLVRKKKPRVMWKRHRDVRIVVPDMRPMVGRGGDTLTSTVEKPGGQCRMELGMRLVHRGAVGQLPRG